MIAAGIFIFAVIFSNIPPVISKLNSLFFMAKIPNEYVSIILRCLGICFVTQFSSDSCRDAGQTALASKVEIAGKVLVVVASLPFFEKIIEISLKLLQKA
jgi:stage III sporulation protein AD